jgi:hypothetical protein
VLWPNVGIGEQPCGSSLFMVVSWPKPLSEIDMADPVGLEAIALSYTSTNGNTQA